MVNYWKVIQNKKLFGVVIKNVAPLVTKQKPTNAVKGVWSMPVTTQVLNSYERNMNTTEISKYMSFILRHRPEAIGLTLDEHGWAEVDPFIEGIAKRYPFDRKLLEEIVQKDSKKRYSFSEDKTKIRANQGHSVDVDVELKETPPPKILYHGTGEKYVRSIQKEGLKAKSRLYVHLTDNPNTAQTVGKRHGTPWVFQVDSEKMAENGFVFYLSENGVWLTKEVPAEYLKKCHLYSCFHKSFFCETVGASGDSKSK